MSSTDDNKVAILMGTFQGEKYILEQLESFRSQSHNNWVIFVSDDGSTDETIKEIERFATEYKYNITIINGPQSGFVSNFLSLLSKENVKANYYSFSDQDDIWHHDKIERAVKWLATQPIDKPALYCSRTHIINEQGCDLGFSPHFKHEPSFKNALIQSIAGANTMLFNQAARDVITEAGIVDVISHDWWIYILITGVGGTVYYDSHPTLDYRQHVANLIGFESGFRKKFAKLSKIFDGQFRQWNARHINALEKNYHLLTVENKNKFEWFKKIHKSSLLVRAFYYFRLGLHRKNFIDDVAIFFLVLLKKI